MAWTYTTLKAEIRSYLEITSDDFSASGAVLNDTDIAIIVQQAEDRILKSVQLPIFRKSLSATLTSSSQYYTFPTDMLSAYSLAVDNSGFEFLIFKKVTFIREVYPDSTVTGVPRYYANFDGLKFILGPTPNANFAIELNYFYHPASIVTASTSWLGDNAESELFAGCLLEAYIFLKGEPDLIQTYATRYEDALGKLKLLGEGRNETDSYRNG